ncbi:chalcone isomerase family protein [Wenzhouxiangella sp. XN24]|uniref:chalcone isomerase family protein n=1 Tax=Wenzhouxiangella sp. XN24 TaxID=2713569 RepID=UPI0013EC1FFA|nr:chalcone isomerase family protein [Wenzhouxiangella sp. XN24]NGX16333.1 hypothetical protein [Wenzhouxiangella sp. XN24]
MNTAKIIVPWTLVLGMLLTPGMAHSDETRGTARFSDSLRIDYSDEQRVLRQTGQTVRRQYFMQIYAMAHYLEGVLPEDGDSLYRSIIDAPGIKQITMVFLRDLSAGQIQESLSSGLRSNASKERYESIRPDIEIFMSAINDDVKSSDEFVLRWYPDGTMDSYHEGTKVSSISNAELAETMWSIWFGESSVVDRSALVERLSRADEAQL